MTVGWIKTINFLLKTSCSGRHTLRVTGVSNLDFRAGFSSVPVSEFNHTRERPIKGAKPGSFNLLSLIWREEQVQTMTTWRYFFVSQDFQPMFCWNARAWSLPGSWATWSSCPARVAPYAPSPSLCPLTSANKDCGVSRSSAPPPRASSSRWQAKTRRATASKGCPVSPTPTSFQARQPPSSRATLLCLSHLINLSGDL